MSNISAFSLILNLSLYANIYCYLSCWLSNIYVHGCVRKVAHALSSRSQLLPSNRLHSTISGKQTLLMRHATSKAESRVHQAAFIKSATGSEVVSIGTYPEFSIC